MFSISLVSAFYYGYLLIAVFSLKHIFKAKYILAPILHEKQLFVYAYLFVYKNFMVPDTKVCICASGSVITKILNFSTLIKVSCLH